VPDGWFKVQGSRLEANSKSSRQTLIEARMSEPEIPRSQSVKRFEDLKVWQLSRSLSHQIYIATGKLPFRKDFQLRDQIRGAAISVMSNIAEGFERGGNRELIQFLALAKGSCGEIRSQLILAGDLGYLPEEDRAELARQSVSVSKMLNRFIEYLRSSALVGYRKRSGASSRP
jgi:four helix bundle protein